MQENTGSPRILTSLCLQGGRDSTGEIVHWGVDTGIVFGWQRGKTRTPIQGLSIRWGFSRYEARKMSGAIQSSNYVPGVSGWKLDTLTGEFEINSCILGSAANAPERQMVSVEVASWSKAWWYRHCVAWWSVVLFHGHADAYTHQKVCQ